MSGVQVDVSEVRQLVADMREIPAELARHVRPAVAKGALNIKNQLRDEWKKSTHFTGAPINYDIEDDGYSAEIGPEHKGAGNLANIAYFGGSNGGGGTVPDPEGALNAEAPKFEKALGDILEDLL